MKHEQLITNLLVLHVIGEALDIQMLCAALGDLRKVSRTSQRQMASSASVSGPVEMPDA